MYKQFEILNVTQKANLSDLLKLSGTTSSKNLTDLKDLAIESIPLDDLVESERQKHDIKLEELKRQETRWKELAKADEQEQKEAINKEQSKLVELEKHIEDVHYDLLNAQYESTIIALGFDKSISKISPLRKDATIQIVYEAIPQNLLWLLTILSPEKEFKEPTNPNCLIDDVLKYYINESAYSFFKYDLLVNIIEKILKKILDVSFLPLPSITTVYLFVLWKDMLKTLNRVCFPTSFLSKKQIVAIALSIVVIIFQIINREEIVLSSVRSIYSGAVYAKDFVKSLPSDVKQWLTDTLHIQNTSDISIVQNIETWNNSLGKVVNISDLSMGKALDMLYTFRVGSTFVDYSLTGKGLQIKSLSDYWERYGPLPQDIDQRNKLIKLYTQGLYNKSPKTR